MYYLSRVMKVIGLTGGIGSGKSQFAKYLADCGAVVINADKLGHQILKPGSDACKEITAAFGKEIITPEGEVDRSRLAEVVFNDRDALQQLNRITHPKILQVVRARLEEERQKGTVVVVIEAPLLIEAGWRTAIDEVWVVTASESTILKRLKKRGGLTESQMRARIHAQISDAERLKHADTVINNDGSADELKATARRLWDKMTAT